MFFLMNEMIPSYTLKSTNILTVTILVFSLMTPSFENDIFVGKFAQNYFSNRNIHQVVVFGCWKIEASVKFSHFLHKFNIKTAYIPVKNELGMEAILKINYYKLGIFLDLDCPQSEIIFHQFWDHRLKYNESYWWLITTDREIVPTNVFRTLPLNIATEMTVAVRNNNGYALYDVYNPSYRHGARINITSMGYWNLDDGLNIELGQYKYKRRGNLFGLTLNSSIALDHTPIPDFMTYINNPINRHFDTMHRFNYGIITQLRDYYNFTINLQRGSTWGYLLPNGSYSGILGDMTKGLVDISVTPFNYKKDRLNVAEFTVQTWVARICLIFRHPQKNELSNVFLKPFRASVWCCVVIVGAITWLLLYCTVKVEQHYDWREPVNTLDTNISSEVGLITAAAICQQGLSDGPRSYSGRIVFLFLFIWALLMYQFYSASIVGSLLVEIPRYITTPQDVLNSNLEVGYEKSAYNYDFFATSEDPVVKGIFNKKIVVDKKRKKLPSFSADEGMKMVKNGGFALHIDTAMAYKIIEETFEENEICELQEIYLTPPVYTSTGLAKHSPFKKMVTYGLRQIIEHGTAQRLRNIWGRRRPQCAESHSSTPVPVMIEEFSPALMVVLFGCALSLLLMILEQIANQRRFRLFENFIKDPRAREQFTS